jgi:NTP pyrophosphatase (non-canonical NTP hydrolase)
LKITDLVHTTAAAPYLDYNAFERVITEETHSDIHTLLGAGIGMSGEVGEFNEILKKHVWQGKPFDEEHAKKELGDILWYWALACIALGVKPEEIEQAVTNKLMARYKSGAFTVEESNNRKKDDI